MKSIIVSAFPGCGKTHLVNKFDGVYNDYSLIDKDNGFLNGYDDYNIYADEICTLIGNVNIIFISQYPEVLQILHSRGYKYIVIAPNNLPLMSSKTKLLNKQQWFGRFILRQNSTEWIKMLEDNYERWTTIEHLEAMQPSRILLLNKDEYLTDIIDDIVNLLPTIYN